MFRFVHAADLHLGAAFRGIRAEDRAVASRLREATYGALTTITDLAIEERAAFVVLAGDLYNRADGNLRAQLALRDAARRLAENDIGLFMVRGNHDYLGPGEPDLDWPDTCRLFAADESDPAVVQINGEDAAQVFGLSYGRRDERAGLAARYPKPRADLFSVAVLHANCGAVADHEPYAPCTAAELTAKGYDYWALGHVHRRGVLSEAAPTIAYPGSPQGLDPSESGPRGCYLVTVDDDRRASLEFRETDAVRWEMREVDIGGMERAQDLLGALEVHLTGAAAGGRLSLFRFRVVGRGPVHRFLKDARNVADLLDDLRGRFGQTAWTESIQARTRPDVDLAARREVEDFLGTFLRISQDLRDAAGSNEDLKQELTSLLDDRAVRQLGLHNGNGAADAASDPRLAGLDASLKDLLDRAEAMGADLLLGEEA